MPISATLHIPGRPLRAERALVRLVRESLSRRWGVRGARIYAAIVSLGVSATIWLVARRYGPDGTALSLVARAAAMLTWIAGGLATLALAAPSKDTALIDGIVALASARGLGNEALARAGMIATVRLLVEVIVVPIIAIGVFVFAFVAGGSIESAFWPIAGAVVFGVVAAIVLGAAASSCQRWGGAQGRSWLMAIVLLPWLLADTIASGRVAPYLSIPGLLGRVWETLTGVGS